MITSALRHLPSSFVAEREFALEAERELLLAHRIDALVSKNSGGSAAAAKLQAARELQVPVVMLERPVIPEVLVVEHVSDAVRWINTQLVELGTPAG